MPPKSTYTFAKSEEICERIACGEPLRKICRDEGMPSARTVYEWMAHDTEFAARFTRARDVGFDAIADEALEISNTPIMGLVETSKAWGVEVRKGDLVDHRKLQVHTRLQLLAKWSPRYRESQNVAITGADGGALQINDGTAATRLATLLAAAEARKRAQGNDQPEDDLSDLI